ncbi:hypothetical protein B2J88_45320 [Rhodococcus sp. SRB_17]|nr:hypothetical protein [Rhodococcus sp. SRB_17]
MVKMSDKFDLASHLFGINGTELELDHVLFTSESGNGKTVLDILREATRWKEKFDEYGIEPGFPVVCAATSTWAWIGALTGLWELGAVPIVGRANATMDSLVSTASAIGARWVLILTPAGFDVVPVPPASGREWSGRGAGMDCLLFGQLTSGSTGEPKVVGHTRRGVVAFGESVPHLYRADPSSVLLSSADLGFGYGFGNALLLPLLTGSRVVLGTDPTHTDALIATLDRESVTIAALSPRVWAGIGRRLVTSTKRIAPSLRTAVSAGEALPDDLRRTLESHLDIPILDGYGATEILHIVAVRRRAESAIESLPGVTLGTVISEGANVLTVIGDMVSPGYLHSGDSDRCRLTEQRFVSADAVSISGPELRIIGRSDTLINRGGLLFSPVELEGAALSVLGLDSIAAEVPVDGGGSTRLVLGVVSKDIGAGTPKYGKQLRSRLADPGRIHLRPDIVTAIPTLPLTDTGKLDRKAGKAMLSRRVGSRARWRDVRGGSGKRFVIIPCAGADLSFYSALFEKMDGAAGGLEIDLASITDIDDLIEKAACILEAETSVGDWLVGHSLGSVVLAAVAARHPGALVGRGTVALCPPRPSFDPAEFASLATATEEMLRGRVDGGERAMARASRRAAADLTTAAGPWLDHLGLYLSEFVCSAEVTADNDPFIRDGSPVTACRRHIRFSSGGHYLPLTDPGGTLEAIGNALQFESAPLPIGVD